MRNSAVVVAALYFHCFDQVSAFVAIPTRHHRVAKTSQRVLPRVAGIAGKEIDLSLDEVLPIQDEAATVSQQVFKLSSTQLGQTVGYRVALLGVSVAYSLELLLPVLQDAGLSVFPEVDPILPLAAIGFTTAAAALAPKAGMLKSGAKKKSVMLVDGKVLAASVATLVAGQPLVGLAALFVREIYYFGLAYKMEAALGLAASLWVLLSPGDPSGVPDTVACLALAVMVFGKIFEPLQEDWNPNQSEFLAKDKL
ncbi:expressed unknown protein [Seminavis robusta]|uniref:Uncharacterized protein n=1 Tax=Seminavis robusta TaxID=568900 RepID=A0A9N8H7T6_9STRA|nr:expressed unknown protein [Seminavis robusta]|eukprot:Sro139_g065000.1 n/a (253) ;mRNA; r:23905-24663